MTFTLPPLPYDKKLLSPTISAQTMEFHYEKHHRGYVEKLNALTANSPLSKMTLEGVIAETWGDKDSAKIFNNAAQVWNHTFFWNSMTPEGGERRLGRFSARIEAGFGSYKKFETEFVEKAVAQFGSGWVWLVSDADELKVVATDDAVTPSVLGLRPVLTCDVWEHAYYLDYQNDREKFVRGFLQRLANWDFAGAQLADKESRSAKFIEARA